MGGRGWGHAHKRIGALPWGELVTPFTIFFNDFAILILLNPTYFFVILSFSTLRILYYVQKESLTLKN